MNGAESDAEDGAVGGVTEAAPVEDSFSWRCDQRGLSAGMTVQNFISVIQLLDVFLSLSSSSRPGDASR